MAKDEKSELRKAFDRVWPDHWKRVQEQWQIEALRKAEPPSKSIN
jgi:hypothetical protein